MRRRSPRPAPICAQACPQATPNGPQQSALGVESVGVRPGAARVADIGNRILYTIKKSINFAGVLGVLLGEAALLGSVGIAIWAAIFAAVNTAWFILGEEPGLDRRFGEEYREYKREVPRWVPRRTPWRPVP